MTTEEFVSIMIKWGNFKARCKSDFPKTVEAKKNKELEDKLSMEHVASVQDTVTEGNGMKFEALQAVRTDSYGYFLIEMTVPDGIEEWNGDILFEECEVVGTDFGCVYGFVEDSFAEQKVLLELQIMYYEEKLPDGARIRVRLKDLVHSCLSGSGGVGDSSASAGNGQSGAVLSAGDLCAGAT